MMTCIWIFLAPSGNHSIVVTPLSDIPSVVNPVVEPTYCSVIAIRPTSAPTKAIWQEPEISQNN